MSPATRQNPQTAEPFNFQVRVYYEDTDAAGIVYHPNYVKFAERGRTEFMRACGWDHQKLLAEFGVVLVVRHIEIGFRAPAKLDDLLDVETTIAECGKTSLTIKQRILKANKALAEIEVVVVAITREGKPVLFPPQLRQIFVDKA